MQRRIPATLLVAATALSVDCGGRIETIAGAGDGTGSGASGGSPAVGAGGVGTGRAGTGGAGTGGIATGGAGGGGGSAADAGECIRSEGVGGCGSLACAQVLHLDLRDGHTLWGCCPGSGFPVTPNGPTLGCCGVDTTSFNGYFPAFGLPSCAKRSAFDVISSQETDPSCSPDCDAACPGIDVGVMWILPVARLAGCCRPDGTCGGTTASLPQFARDAFGSSPECITEADLNRVFGSAIPDWTLPLGEPAVCTP